MIVRAIPVHGGWVHIHWTVPGKNKFSAFKEVKQIEEKIRRDGVSGWLMESDKSHTTMHKIIEKLGGVKYAEDKESNFYKKEMK